MAPGITRRKETQRTFYRSIINEQINNLRNKLAESFVEESQSKLTQKEKERQYLLIEQINKLRGSFLEIKPDPRFMELDRLRMREKVLTEMKNAGNLNEEQASKLLEQNMERMNQLRLELAGIEKKEMKKENNK